MSCRDMTVYTVVENGTEHGSHKITYSKNLYKQEGFSLSRYINAVQSC